MFKYIFILKVYINHKLCDTFSNDQVQVTESVFFLHVMFRFSCFIYCLEVCATWTKLPNKRTY